jgi:hypothetical protein
MSSWPFGKVSSSSSNSLSFSGDVVEDLVALVLGGDRPRSCHLVDVGLAPSIGIRG